jgi:hypothetical protein
MMANKQALAELYGALNNGDASMLQAPLADLESFAAKIAPALQAAGMSFDDLKTHPQAAADAIRAYNDAADSAQGRSKAVGDALAGMASEMDTNVTKASALKSALDSLFGIEMNQSQATDAWHASLQALNTQIDGTKGKIDGFSKGALDNRAAIRNSVQALEDKINADAAAGVSGDKLAGSLVRGRNAIIKQARRLASPGVRSEVPQHAGPDAEEPLHDHQDPGLLTAHQQVKALGEALPPDPEAVGDPHQPARHGPLQGRHRRPGEEVPPHAQAGRDAARAIDNASGPASRVASIYPDCRARSSRASSRTTSTSSSG